MDNLTKNIILTPMNLLYKLSPELCTKLMFRLKTGNKLNLNNPITYNEKLQWLKLYDRNELIPGCADKFTSREYVKACGCGDILNDLIWEGFKAEEIPFSKLPERFVIKVTHGSTFNIICKNKKELNIPATIALLKKWLKADFLPCYGEWFYGVEKPRIIVEKYLENISGEPLFDFKFFCFHGIPKFMYVDTWKNGMHSINAYDTEFNLIPGVKLGYDNDLETPIKKPEKFQKMLEYSKKLSKPFIHVRVDFYNVNGKIVFGEFTFTKSAGFANITPNSFNVKMGNWIKLPNKQNK
jgi:hypothetical protein